MYDDPGPTLHRRELGAHLRRLRLERGWATKDVADRLSCSVSKVSRMETGARGVSQVDARALVAAFNLQGDDADRLLTLARGGKKRIDNRAAIVVESDYIRITDPSFVELERASTHIREYNSLVVPGLLQTESYMRASIRGSMPDLNGASLEDVVSTRLSRQKILSRDDPLSFDVILDEAALRREVGGPDVMGEQISEILKAIDRGLVQIAVIPFTAGSHPGVNSDFVALQIGEPSTPDVIFVEGLAGHLRFDKPHDVARYQRVWKELGSHALTVEESYCFLVDVGRDFGRT